MLASSATLSLIQGKVGLGASWKRGWSSQKLASLNRESTGLGSSKLTGQSPLPSQSVSRSYASKSGDLFEGALGGKDAVKDGGAKTSNLLKPRIPVQRSNLDPKKMRSRYRHKNFLESVAHRRKVPTSMKKVWQEARAIRRLPLTKAIRFLSVYPTKSARHLLSTVKQAQSNAVWRGFKPEDLEISRTVIGKATFLKRMMPHAKGRAGRVNHPFHHLSVFVRPTKKALKEASAKTQSTGASVESTPSSAPEPIPTKPSDANTQTKKSGWWPFGKKEEATL